MMKKIISVLLSLTILFTLSVTAFAAPPTDLISEDKAKSIVLKDSGFTEEEVVFTKTKLDFDDGIYEYEIEFRVGSAEEYEYTLDAKSGRVIDYDYDYEPYEEYHIEQEYDLDDRYDYDDKAEKEVEIFVSDIILKIVVFLRNLFA